jgi:hypothetical protein
MAGDIKLRDDSDAAITRISEELTNLVLSVIEAVGTHLVQPGKPAALDSEALILRQMKMQHIQFHRRHAVKISLDDFNRLPVAADIYQEASPGEARFVLNLRERDKVAVPISVKKLQEGFQPAQDTDNCRRTKIQPNFAATRLRCAPLTFSGRARRLLATAHPCNLSRPL